MAAEERKALQKAATDDYNKAFAKLKTIRTNRVRAAAKIARLQAGLEKLDEKADTPPGKNGAADSTKDRRIIAETGMSAEIATDNELVDKENDAITEYNKTVENMGRVYNIKTTVNPDEGVLALVEKVPDTVGSHITDKAFDDIVATLMEQTREKLRGMLNAKSVAVVTPAAVTGRRGPWVRSITKISYAVPAPATVPTVQTPMHTNTNVWSNNNVHNHTYVHGHFVAAQTADQQASNGVTPFMRRRINDYQNSKKNN